jgi:branched-chain amino acid transport system substrate-binding protein
MPAQGRLPCNDAGALFRSQQQRGIMVEKHLVHRRTVIQGTLALASAGIAGLRSAPSLAQSTQGVTDSEVLFGALGQLTGPFAFIGAPGRDNMQLAVEKINAAGGINGRKLRLIFEHASTPAESVAAAKKLVENDKVFVLVIASGSTGAAAAADYVRSAQIPTYNTVGATPIIRDPFARNVFHGTIPPASITGQAMIDIAFQAVANATRIGVLAGTYAFPQSHLAEIKPRLEKRGGLEVVVEQFDAAASDFTAQLVSFVRRRVQVVLILGSFTEAGFAIKQAPEKGLTDVRYVVDGSAVNNAIIPLIGADATKNVWGYFNAPYFPAQDDPPIADYRRLLVEKYGALPQGRPNIYDLIGYGSTYILAQVLKKTGRDLSWQRLIESWETLRDAKPSDMGGYDVIFPETVTPTDHQGNKKVASARIINGSWRVVGLAS